MYKGSRRRRGSHEHKRARESRAQAVLVADMDAPLHRARRRRGSREHRRARESQAQAVLLAAPLVPTEYTTVPHQDVAVSVAAPLDPMDGTVMMLVAAVDGGAEVVLASPVMTTKLKKNARKRLQLRAASKAAKDAVAIAHSPQNSPMHPPCILFPSPTAHSPPSLALGTDVPHDDNPTYSFDHPSLSRFTSDDVPQHNDSPIAAITVHDRRYLESATTPNVRPTVVVTQTRPLDITPMCHVHVDHVGVVDAVPPSTLRRSPRNSPPDGSLEEIAAVTSIREGSRQRSLASFSQGDRSSSYAIDYRHQGLSLSSQGSLTVTPFHANEEPLFSQLSPMEMDPVTSPDDTNPVPVLCRRVCFCDNTLFPKECKACKAKYYKDACFDHTLITCTSCTKQFHIACVARHLGITVVQGETPPIYRCQECSTTVEARDVPYVRLGQHSAAIKNRRLGVPSDQNSFSLPPRCEIYARDQSIKLLKLHANPDACNSILNNDPRPFPSNIPIDPEQMEKHVVHGRRFEISQLLVTVQMCSCCGKVQPGNVDFRGSRNSAPPFERKAFTNVYRKGWHCTCLGFCNGSQFYSDRIPIKAYFREKHENKSPWEVIHDVPDMESHNAILCDNCFELPKEDLPFPRKFSLMNGFGPAYCPLPIVPSEAPEVAASRELHSLLTSFTSAEEMAIRQIAPFIRITKLRQGNIGMVGNTSCAHVHSRLSQILPNLPTECKVIILKYRHGDQGLASTQFRRDRIQRALTLLRNTGHPAWSHIQVSEEHLSQWPEEGDLTQDEMGLSAVVGNPPPPDPSESHQPRQANNDMGDLGPAPNQFVIDDEVEETTHGLICLNDENGAHGAETAICEDAIGDRVQRIRALDGGIAPKMNIRGDTVEFANQDVLPTDGFVDMNEMEWAYAKAFPTLFIPWYGPLGGNAVDGFVREGWHITHDFRGWDTVRSKIPKFSEWTEFETWRSDGMVAKHPTAALVMYNQKVKNLCNQQGHYVLNISGLDASTTVAEIRESPNNEEVMNHVNWLIKKAHIHTASVAGTRKYWQKIYTKYQAITHWHSYIHERELTSFHTGSLAEYHDYFLRQLLCKYKRSLSGSVDADCDLILTNDTAFTKAVNDYKHVCSHFLAMKMELWYAHFLKPVYGISHANVTFEFAKSRGVIHYHSPQFTEAEYNAPISEAMRRTQDAVVSAGEQLDAKLDNHYNTLLDSFNGTASRSDFLKSFPHLPSDVTNNKGKEYRQDFVKHVNDAEITSAWEHGIGAIEIALVRCAKELEPVMHGRYGLGAMHTGNAPCDWVKPGSNPAANHNYRPTCNEMQDNAEVVRRGEGKRPKFFREGELGVRAPNTQNHHLCHRCNDYCAKCKKHTRTFDEMKDKDVPDEYCYTDTRGVKRVKFEKKDCRFHFGEFLAFDPSGQGNLTRGKDRIDTPYVSHDNGVMRYNGMRNHPRVIQGPHANLYFGANNDTQFHLHGDYG
jgi:hypothetical protein